MRRKLYWKLLSHAKFLQKEMEDHLCSSEVGHDEYSMSIDTSQNEMMGGAKMLLEICVIDEYEMSVIYEILLFIYTECLLVRFDDEERYSIIHRCKFLIEK